MVCSTCSLLVINQIGSQSSVEELKLVAVVVEGDLVGVRDLLLFFPSFKGVGAEGVWSLAALALLSLSLLLSCRVVVGRDGSCREGFVQAEVHHI